MFSTADFLGKPFASHKLLQSVVAVMSSANRNALSTTASDVEHDESKTR